jgi:hypothetical protein
MNRVAERPKERSCGDVDWWKKSRREVWGRWLSCGATASSVERGGDSTTHKHHLSFSPHSLPSPCWLTSSWRKNTGTRRIGHHDLNAVWRTFHILFGVAAGERWSHNAPPASSFLCASKKLLSCSVYISAHRCHTASMGCDGRRIGHSGRQRRVARDDLRLRQHTYRLSPF